MNVSQSLWTLKQALEPYGRAHEAQWLLCHALEADPQKLPLLLGQPLTEEAHIRLNDCILRAQRGEPLQYILGRWEFYGRTFLTDSRALIPRPETEMLIREGLLRMGDRGSFADVGCGSGCIGLTLALERPGWKGTLLDISPDALSLAAENQALWETDCSLVNADMNKAMPGGPYDLIVSNPPYVGENQRELMDPWVLAYEPPLALFAGDNGMASYAALADRLGDSLKNGGWIIVECGIGQAEKIQTLWEPFCDELASRRDENNIERVVIGRKKIDAAG